jgi:hypothetical protein
MQEFGDLECRQVPQPRQKWYCFKYFLLKFELEHSFLVVSSANEGNTPSCAFASLFIG